MVLRNILIYTLFFIVGSHPGFSQDGSDLHPKHQKRLNKAIEKTFTSGDIRISVIRLQDSLQAELNKPHLSGKVLEIYSDDILMGYAVITSAKGRFDYFDFMVIYGNNHKIEQIEILEYRSDHGYQITNKKWLSQFYGKTGCNLRVSKEIDALSGATLSVNGLVDCLNDICEMLESTIGNRSYKAKRKR